MDLLIRNAKVWTVDPANPVAEAVSVRDGRIVAVGDDRSVREAVSPSAEEIDENRKDIFKNFASGDDW